MASMSQAGSGFGPKLRSRKHGAATPLDDLDKRLLNLMQGTLPDRATALPARRTTSGHHRI